MSSSLHAPHVMRPSMPVLVWLVVGLWTGVALGHGWVWRAYVRGAPGDPTILVAIGVTIVGFGLLLRWRVAVALLIVMGLCAGVALGALYWGRWRADVALSQSDRATRRTLEVLADESVSVFGTSSPCRILGGLTDGALVTVQWPAGTAAPALGQRVQVIGTLKAPAPDARGRRAARTGNVGTLRARHVSDAGWTSSARGVVGRLRLWAVQRMARIRGDGGALLSGVVVGDRRRLTGSQADTDFRTTGLTHLVAVSGSHLVVVAGVVGWLLTVLGTGRILRSLMVASVVGGYVVFSGMQPSALRAWVMAVAAASAWLSGRRADGGSTLTVAVGALLVASPAAAFDLGFQLSVAAVAGLVLFARYAETWLSAALGDHAGWLATPVALTLTATIATVPITVSTFGMMSLISPVANIVAGPAVSCALIVGLVGLAVSAASGTVGTLMLEAAAVPAWVAVRIARGLAGWPYAAVPVGVAALPAAVACAALGALVWATWPTPSPRRARMLILLMVVVLVAIAIGPPPPSGASIVMLDVGQGDALLVRDGTHAVLVDAGPNATSMRAALARSGIRRLDAIVITHMHADHYGGLESLHGVVRVGSILVPSGAIGQDSGGLEAAKALVGAARVREVDAGDRFAVGGLEVDVLSPRQPAQDAAENAASVVLRVRRGRFTALLTGDAESDVVGPLIEEGTLGDIDVFKVGHHGSTGAISAGQLAVLRPEYSLISVGEGNRFGHPTPSMLADLSGSGSRVVRTDLCGDVTVRIARDGRYRVRLGRPRGALLPGGTKPILIRGLACARCATLKPTFDLGASGADHTTESHGKAALRVQAGIPDIRRPRPPPRACARTAEAQRRGTRRLGLQLRDV